jgi:drug/metabolite transporter (DMT)-like permease
VAWRWRTNPGIVVWLCTGLVLVGVAVLGRFDWRALHLGRGELETLASSLFFMGQILALERKEFALNRVLPVTVVMFGLETIAFAAVSVASAPEWAAFGRLLALPSWWAFTIPMTVFCTIGAYVLMNTWQPRISSTEAGLIYCVEPIFSALISLFLPGLMSVWALISYPNEELTSHLLIGGGLITVANILLQLRPAPVALKPASA